MVTVQSWLALVVYVLFIAQAVNSELLHFYHMDTDRKIWFKYIREICNNNYMFF